MTLAPRAFVIGHPIAHSRSPLLHRFWLDHYGIEGSYERIDVAPEALPAFVRGLRATGFAGGNVTIPHKTAVLPLVEAIDPAAQAIGAANTLWFEGGRLWAGNTDASGFVASLDAEAPRWDAGARRAVVMGAGGAARAVVHGLIGRGLTVDIVNRTIETAADIARSFGPNVRAFTGSALAALLPDADLLVNATSLGMTGKPPLICDLAPLKQTAVVADLVYVPLRTALVREAAARGHRSVGGLGMLLHQAAPGFARWFGRSPVVSAALRERVEADVDGRC